MIARLRERVADQSGASFLIGLVVFMICAAVASIAIASASANASKSGSVQGTQQAYLTVSSAARLLADDLASQQPILSGTVETRSHACPYPHDDDGVVGGSLALTRKDGSAIRATALMQMIDQAKDHIDPTNPASDYGPVQFTVQAEGFDDVTGTFAMDATYAIDITLRKSGGSAYGSSLSMHIPASAPGTSTVSADSAETHNDVWNWGSEEYVIKAQTDPAWADANRGMVDAVTGEMVPASNEFGYSTPSTYTIVDATTTTQVEWGGAQIGKGKAE